jgi:hypothetical protein
MTERKRLYRYDHHPHRARYEERLSGRQRDILLALLFREPGVTGSIILYDDDPHGARQQQQCAEGWTWSGAPGNTASDRASWSRSLKRLETRGLVERISRGDGSHRTRKIRLTARGKKTAKRLTI